MGFVFLISLIFILFLLLLFNFFETSKKLECMNAEIKELKIKAEIPTVGLSSSEALDALKEEIEARKKKAAEETAATKKAENEAEASEN